MRISDWSSDVCSSDLRIERDSPLDPKRFDRITLLRPGVVVSAPPFTGAAAHRTGTAIALICRSPGRCCHHIEKNLPQWARPRVRSRQRLSLIIRSEEHTSELQSLMRISYAVFCL